ncbi:hypothetical protein ACIRYZ_37895 [Kitasatospora sp. NPDC101155]|uniref:hypothetical protein n=1 Tax=Kitasatospora sp. NPDC101155 TaxID=3364097 RepID=UPI00381413E7
MVELSEQAAHQLVDGAGRVGPEGTRLGGGLGQDVLVQALEGLPPRLGPLLELLQRGVQRTFDGGR